MGCCTSAEEKREKNASRFGTSIGAILRAVSTKEPNLTGIFTSTVGGYRLAMDVDELEARAKVEAEANRIGGDILQQWRDYKLRYPLDAANRRPSTLVEDNVRSRIVAAWLKFDKDSSGDLSLEEVEKMVVALNLPDFLSKQLLAKVKKSASTQGQASAFDFNKFEESYRSLCSWDELNFCWMAASEGATDPAYALTNDQLRTYLRVVQGEGDNVTEQRMNTILGSLGGRLDRVNFMRFLTDPGLNGVHNPATTDQVYQDMTRPFHEYFMSSSHNTYLSGDQLTSDSKPECYKKALLDGCRCVELDCWDGPSGKPIIYHGYTRTSKISFESVIQAIHETAFVTSAYPVTLSLEIHTSLEQQAEMARIMRAIFGDTLAEPKWFPGETPTTVISPQAYMRKIIVKGKRLPPGLEVPDDDDDDDDDDDSKAADIKKAKSDKPAAAKKTLKMAPELSSTVIMESKHMKKWEEAFAKAVYYECVSTSEGKAIKYAEKETADIIRHNKLRFSRIYPAGSRINSSNYHPQIHWNVGAQIVALNWQTHDSYELRLNKGRFLENGSCGFVLKPDYLRDPGVLQSSRAARTLTVEIISAYCLPKPKGEGSTSEVVDPYIKVFVEGPNLPPTKDHALKTATIDDNGFHPVFLGVANHPSKFTITLPIPEMCTLVVQAFDKDVDFDDFLAECFVPLNTLRTGVRAFPLWDVESLDLPAACIIARVEYV